MASPRAFNASSFRAACTCSCASESPVRQLAASRPTIYSLPRLEIVPSSTAVLPVRWQISRAIWLVNRSSGGRPIRDNVSFTFSSERMLRKGDCRPNRERRLQRVVKYRIARAVGKIGEDDGVLVGQVSALMMQ